jgi:serine/threonine protein kinase
MTKFSIPYFDHTLIQDIPSIKKTHSIIDPSWKRLGNGAFGSVFAIDAKHARQQVDLLDSHYRGFWSLPRGDNTVVLKVMKAPDSGGRKWLRNALRELYIQYHLSTAPSKKVHNKQFDVKKYTPTPYFGGYIRSSREFIICMKMQPGKPLSNSTLRSKRQYLEIEKAYISMLLNNVLHIDFHSGNVMVSEDGSIHLVDFGGAVLLTDVMTPAQLQALKTKLHTFISFWPEHTTYVNQRKTINETIININTLLNLENELNIVAQSASGTLLDMRGLLRNKKDIQNLISRRLNVSKTDK